MNLSQGVTNVMCQGILSSEDIRMSVWNTIAKLEMRVQLLRMGNTFRVFVCESYNPVLLTLHIVSNLTSATICGILISNSGFTIGLHLLENKKEEDCLFDGVIQHHY